MSLKTFKHIFEKVKGNLTQIAFGIGDIGANLDMMDIFQYCRKNAVIPNVTINGVGMTAEWAKKLASVCGSLAVSCYGDNSICYDAADRLLLQGAKQINIHQILSEETFDACNALLKSIKYARDKGQNYILSKINAVVFLSVKPKGRAADKNFHPISLSKLGYLIQFARMAGIPIGFDSCLAPKVLYAIRGDTSFEKAGMFIEPCEAGLFSGYINVQGIFYPCSFAEGVTTRRSVLNCDDFVKDIWYSDLVRNWRSKLSGSTRDCNCSLKSECRCCPIYDLTSCKGG